MVLQRRLRVLEVKIMSLESSEEKMAWCQNSRRWLVFMDLAMRYPEFCPHNGQCAKGYCGYFEERTPSKYVLRKLAVLQTFTEKENT